MKKQILYTVCATALLSSCNIYTSYERPDDIQASGLYRDTISVADTLVSDTSTIANLPWRELFTDPQLQSLIEQGLADNTDLQIAMLQVKEAEAALMTARLSYLPSFALSPQGTISSFDKAKATQTYQLPITASWELDVFGRIRNAKKAAKSVLLRSEAYQQAVQTQLIATIANSYYTLLMLDEQLAITEETAAKWKVNVETMKAMKEAAMTNEAAVVQSEATYYQVVSSLPDIRRSIRETENALSLVLKQSSQSVVRGKLNVQTFPSELTAGVPLQLLANRPDVRMAEMALSSSFYATNQARSAFYPSINITGSAGWTNSAGIAIVNPAKFLASVVGSLTQPLFNKGALIANLKISKAQQEEAKLSFQQSILNAGSEVNNALFLYHTSNEKAGSRGKQVEFLEKSVEYTTDLFKSGITSTSYLEILTAEQSLLSARLSQTSDNFERMQAVVNLYHALGGGKD